LPERLPGSLQQFVGSSCRDSLHVLSDLRRRSLGLDQEVNVIRHHHEGDETVKCADPVAIQNGPGEASGDLRLSEPDGPQRRVSKLSVGFNESTSVADRAQWQCAMESKGNEKCCSVGLKMGKVTAIFHVRVVVSRVEISHRLKPVPPTTG